MRLGPRNQKQMRGAPTSVGGLRPAEGGPGLGCDEDESRLSVGGRRVGVMDRRGEEGERILAKQEDARRSLLVRRNILGGCMTAAPPVACQWIPATVLIPAGPC